MDIHIKHEITTEGDEEREVHESFGMASFRRTSCSDGAHLFGSALRHNNVITFCVERAEVSRHLNQDWYHGGKILSERRV